MKHNLRDDRRRPGAAAGEQLARETWEFLEELIDTLAEEGALCEGEPRRRLASRLRTLRDQIAQDPPAAYGGAAEHARALGAASELCAQAESPETPALSAHGLTQMQRALRRAIHGSKPR